MFFGGQKREPARGSRIVPVQTVQAGEAPNTVVSVAITKPGSVVSSPGVMTLSEFQNLMAQGYVSVEEQTEADTAADVQIDAEGNPVAEEEAQAVEADSGELVGEGVAKNGDETAENEVLPQEEAGGTEPVAETEAEIQPIGKGVFGNIYDQFKGKIQQAVDFLLRQKDGDLLGVFNRDGFGEIDFVWGDQRGGFSHILDKHIGQGKSFSTAQEATETIDDIIKTGKKTFEDTDKAVFEKDGQVVTVRKNFRQDGKKIADKNWVLTAYDRNSADAGTGATTDINQARAAQGTELSADKGTEIPSENQVQLPVNPVAEKWNALVKDNEGDEAEALDTAMQMVGNKTAELEAARKTVTKGKSEEAIQEAKRAKREKVSALETELRFWQDVAAYPEKKRAAEEQAAKLNARMERERKRRESGAVNPNYGLRQTEADERLGTPLSLREYIIRKIATGRVKFLWGASESGTGGLKEHGGVAKRQMLYTDKAKGQYPEDAAEAMRLDIMDNHPELGAVDADAILSEIENLAVGEQTPSEMMDEAERLHERSERFVTDDRQAEDMAPESDGAAEVAAPPVEAETQDGKPRFAGEVFADEDWMKRDDSEEVPFQRVEGAATSPRATERQAKAIARQLKKLGLKGKVRIVDGVGELVKEARARLQSVFHGSPHDFEAFDFSHMGEGEGAQAYGWGGYVTEVEGIGESYTGAYNRSALYKGKKREDVIAQYNAGVEKERNYVILSVISFLIDGRSFEDAKAITERNILDSLDYQIRSSGNEVNKYKQQLAELKSLSADDFSVVNGRNLYHVEIPTEQDGNYLRWDGRADAVIDRVGISTEEYEAQDMATGKDVYEYLGRKLGSDKAASEFLSSLGFVGVSYPAEYQSGGRADNARNYVIFKESDMKITDHIRYEQDGNGEIAGATLPNGDVLLNRGAMRVDTPFHEFAHKLFTYAKNNRAASRLYDAIRRYAQNAPQSVKDYVSAHYPGLSEDAYLDEVFAWALSKQSEGGLEAFLQERGLSEDEAARTWYGQVWDAVKALWAELRPMVSKLMGRDFADLSVFDAYDEMGAEETGKALYDLMMGGKRLPGVAETQSEATRGQRAEEAGLSDEERGIVERAKADGTYLKAPNGKPTQLSPKQWAQVRTKAFKDWFGDWELATKQIYVSNANDLHFSNNDEFKQHVEKYFKENGTWKSYINKNTGNKIQLSSTGINKSISNASVEKSDVDRPDHLRALGKLDEILENSILGEVHKDKNGDPNVLEVQRYFGSIIIDGNIYRVKTTVKKVRIKKDETSNQQYAFEVQEMELLEARPAQQEIGGINDANNPTISNNSISAAKLLQGVKKSNSDEEILNASKVVDGNGEPLVVYHGARHSGFSVFDDTEGEKKSDAPEGTAWFSSDYHVARSYSGTYDDATYEPEEDEERGGPGNYACFLNIRNPYYENFEGANWDGSTYGKYLIEVNDDDGGFEESVYKEDGSTLFDSEEEAERYAEEHGIENYEIKANPWIGLTTNEVAGTAKDFGSDGAIIENVIDTGGLADPGEATVYVTFSPNQIKSATDNVGTFDAGDADIRFRFIGEKGAENLDKAEEATTRLDNLAVAREMEEAGKDAKTVKMATGWERGADGKWRYEEADFKVDVNGLARKNNLWDRLPWGKEYDTLLDKIFDDVELSNAESARFDELVERAENLLEAYEATDERYLDDYVKDIKLFEAYPELKRVRVEMYNNPNSNTGATCYANQNLIRVNESALLREDFRNILVHEVQHAIQYIEGFAKGGNSNTYKEHLDSLKEKHDAWSMLKEFDRKYEELGEDSLPIDAYNAVRDEYHSLGFEFGDDGFSSREAFDKGFNLWVRGYDKEGYEESYNEYQRLTNKFGHGLGNDRYRQLSGEVEARNVQKRLDMTPEERRASLASETEDVAREDQIFLNEALGSSASIDEQAPVPAPASVSNAAKRQAAEALSRRLGVPVVIEDGTTPKGRSKRFAGVKGWFVLPNAQNPNGTIHVNVDNHASVDDVERTMLHEVVAHMGMRKMMGEEKYNALLDKVYASMDDAARAYFEAYAAKDFTRREGMTEEAYHAELRRIAADEYIAALAEVGADPSTWQKVVALVREALRALGFNLSLSDADIRALLYESKHNLESAAYSAERELMRREQKEYRDAAELSNRIEEDERELRMTEDGIEETNGRFNEGLKSLTTENADDAILSLGRPSDVLLAAGVTDKPMRLYGNKVMSKIRKHGYPISALLDLPRAVAAPIAVFNNYGQADNRSILTELKTAQGNILVAVTIGKGGADVDFNVVSSVFGKDKEKVAAWINKGYATYIDKKKALDYISVPAPIAGAQYNQGISDATKVIESFENPKLNAGTSPAVRMRRAGTADDPRLGVISLNENAEEYDRNTAQGLYRGAVAVARYFLDDSLPLRHLMTHIRRSSGGVV